MKRTLRCPKSDGQVILRVGEVKELGHSNQSHPLRVAMFNHALGYAAGLGAFETYICKGCGFTEWYAKEIESIITDVPLGTTLLDGGGDKSGPYR